MCPLHDICAIISSMQRTEGWKCTLFWNSSQSGFQTWTLLLLSHSVPLLSILSSGHAVTHDNEIEISKDYYYIIGGTERWRGFVHGSYNLHKKWNPFQIHSAICVRCVNAAPVCFHPVDQPQSISTTLLCSIYVFISFCASDQDLIPGIDRGDKRFILD